MTVVRTVPLEDPAEPRRNDMQSDIVVPNLNANDQRADDATLFVGW